MENFIRRKRRLIDASFDVMDGVVGGLPKGKATLDAIDNASSLILEYGSELLKAVDVYEQLVSDGCDSDEIDETLVEYAVHASARIMARIMDKVNAIVDREKELFLKKLSEDISEVCSRLEEEGPSKNAWDKLPDDVVQKMADDIGVTVDELKRDYALGFIDATGEGITQDDLDNIDVDNMDFKTVDFDDIKRMAEGR